MKLLRNSVLSLVLFLSAIAPSCPRLAMAQTTVIGGLGPGLGQSVNPFDPQVQKAALIKSLQAQADAANAAAAASYLQKSQDWLVNAVAARDANQPIPPITDPPLKLHVDPNTGAQTQGPDRVANKPVLPPPSGTLGSGGSIKSNTPAPDRLDQIMSGMAALWDLITQMQAELVAIKAKVAP